jgi:protein-disulfide isomerase
MATAGSSMKGFYIALAAVALGGGIFILSQAMNAKPPLTTDTVAPISAGPRGVTEGSDSAKVSVLDFSDFECPYCAGFATVQMPDIRQRLIATGKVRWTFMHFPLNGHQKSPLAHLAAACANLQGKFWPMHDVIYQNQAEWVESRNPERPLADYARRIGLDGAQYEQCMDQRAAWGTVLADKQLGDSLGVGGTPTFYINGRLFDERPGLSTDRLSQIVDSLTAPAAAPRGRGR